MLLFFPEPVPSRRLGGEKRGEKKGRGRCEWKERSRGAVGLISLSNKLGATDINVSCALRPIASHKTAASLCVR